MQNTFNAHIDNIWKMTGMKLNALSRITPYLNFDKKKALVNAFFLSHISYLWVCHNRIKKINRLRERCLRLFYNKLMPLAL